MPSFPAPLTAPDFRRPGATLLISCYELGHQPRSVSSPAAFLRRAGFAPALMDIAVEPFNEAAATHAAFVGIAVPMHTALRLGVRVAQHIRVLNPGCHLCFYGMYAALNADYLLAHGADSCIGGEFEAPMVGLLEALAAGEHTEIAGVNRRGYSSPPYLQRLDYPPADPAGLPDLTAYAKLLRDDTEQTVGYVEASRGCKHRCLHCPVTPVYDGRFFAVPRDVVLAEVRQAVEAGARHVTFGDPDFLNGPRHALHIARAMHAEFPELTFDFTAKVEHLLAQRTVLPEFAALGCAFVISAIESFSDDVLAHLEKGHTRADALEALAVARAAGVPLRPSFVPFTPWSTLADYGDLLDIVEGEDLVDAVDPVQLAVRLLVPPGSALLQREAIREHLGPLDEAAFTYAWSHPDGRMDQLHAVVTELVEGAARDKADPVATFYGVRAALADLTGGGAATEAPAEVFRNRARVPRMTESWFC